MSEDQPEIEQRDPRYTMKGRRPWTKNERGEWVPATPLPYFLPFGRTRCDCGRKFRNQKRYSEHYAYEHLIMGRGTVSEES